MVINSSNVALQSSRTFQSHTFTQTASVVTRGSEGVSLELSDKSKSLVEQMNQYKEEMNKRNENGPKLFQNTIAAKKAEKPKESELEPAEDSDIILLRKMLEALEEMRDGKDHKRVKELKDVELPKKTFTFGSLSLKASTTNMNAVVTDLRGTVSAAAGTGTVFTKTTAISSVYSEHERTTFTGTGIAITADGREISFGVDLEMSRAFIERYDAIEKSSYVVCDPLVINLEGGRTSMTDKKYLFDLDTDGKMDEISFVEGNSGFLALDKNKDGVINDGNELFGTKSGDGFADLAEYDEDGNGWIDEADSIFKDLRVWTKDENGNDKLVDLLKADVGAIYLGSADTEFSLKETGTNNTNGIIRKTGVFLKESGGVGTVAHVDIAL